MERYRVVVAGPTQTLVRQVEGKDVTVAYLDPRYATEIVDTLNAVPIANLQKQVGVMSDAVDEILLRLTRMGRDTG